MAEKSYEDLVVTCPDLVTANQLRCQLVEEFSGCWFYVYTQTCEIMVSNDFGGHLREDRVKELAARAAELLTDFQSRVQPSVEEDVDTEELDETDDVRAHALPVQTF